MDEDERLARQLQQEEEAANAAEEARNERLARELSEQLNLEDEEQQREEASTPPPPPVPARVMNPPNTRTQQISLQSGRGTMIRLYHVKTGNHIQEVMYVQNLANNVVTFEKYSPHAADDGVKLCITEDGRVGFQRDATERCMFVAELSGSPASNGSVYLLSCAHKYSLNMWGSVGWYLGMSTDGELQGNNGRTENALWTLVSASVPGDQALQQPRQQRQNQQSRQPQGRPRGGSSTAREGNPILVWLASEAGQEYLQATTTSAASSCATAGTPSASVARSTLYDMYHNSFSFTVPATVQQQKHQHAPPQVQEGSLSFSRPAAHLPLPLCKVLQLLTYYRTEDWEPAAVRYCEYKQRDEAHFPQQPLKLTPPSYNNAQSAGAGAAASTSAPVADNASASSSSTLGDMLGYGSSSRGGGGKGYAPLGQWQPDDDAADEDDDAYARSRADSPPALPSASASASGTPAAALGYPFRPRLVEVEVDRTPLLRSNKQHLLSPAQLRKFAEEGYVVLPGLALVDASRTNSAAGEGRAGAGAGAGVSAAKRVTELVQRCLRLIQYYEGRRLSRHSLPPAEVTPQYNARAPSGSSSDASSGAQAAATSPKPRTASDNSGDTVIKEFFDGICCDPDLLALYYDTPLYSICYQLITATGTYPAKHESPNASAGAGAAAGTSGPIPVASSQPERGPGAHASGGGGAVPVGDIEIELSDIVSSKDDAREKRDGERERGAGGKHADKVQQFIGYAAVSARHPTLTSGAMLLPSLPPTAAAADKALLESPADHFTALGGESESRRWRVGGGGRVAAGSSTTGVRVMVALSDTSSNHPEAAAMRPLDAEEVLVHLDGSSNTPPVGSADAMGAGSTRNGHDSFIGNTCVYPRSHCTLLQHLNPKAAPAAPVLLPKDVPAFLQEEGSGSSNSAGIKKPSLRGLKMLHLRPGDVVICNENLAFRNEVPNFASCDTKYNAWFHVCHKVQHP